MAKKYVRILHEVEAIQATTNNLNELRAFAGDVRRTPTKLGGKYRITCYYTIPGVDVVLWAGDYLIKHPNGRLEVKDSRLFNQEYEPK